MKTRRRTWICAALAVGVLLTALVVGGPSRDARKPKGAPQDEAPKSPVAGSPKVEERREKAGPVATSAGELQLDVQPTSGGAIGAQPASYDSRK